MWSIFKSKYILQYILSYLNESKKLKIIKYNKILQKKIDITIDNYKQLKGKYIIHEGNKIVKEYNILIYEGGYLNGKRNGSWKKVLSWVR